MGASDPLGIPDELVTTEVRLLTGKLQLGQPGGIRWSPSAEGPTDAPLVRWQGCSVLVVALPTTIPPKNYHL